MVDEQPVALPARYKRMKRRKMDDTFSEIVKEATNGIADGEPGNSSPSLPTIDLEDRDFRLLLIRTVRPFPSLWDKCDPNFFNRYDKPALYDHVAKVMAKELGRPVTGKMCQASWRPMFDSLRKARRRAQQEATACGYYREPKWEFWNEMKFVKERLDEEQRAKLASLQTQTEAVLVGEKETTPRAVSSTIPSRGRAKKDDKEELTPNNRTISEESDIFATIKVEEEDVIVPRSNPNPTISPAAYVDDNCFVIKGTASSLSKDILHLPSTSTQIIPKVFPKVPIVHSIVEGEIDPHEKMQGDLAEAMVETITQCSTNVSELLLKTREMHEMVKRSRKITEISPTAQFIDAKLKEMKSFDEEYSIELEGKLIHLVMEYAMNAKSKGKKMKGEK